MQNSAPKQGGRRKWSGWATPKVEGAPPMEESHGGGHEGGGGTKVGTAVPPAGFKAVL